MNRTSNQIQTISIPNHDEVKRSSQITSRKYSARPFQQKKIKRCNIFFSFTPFHVLPDYRQTSHSMMPTAVCHNTVHGSAICSRRALCLILNIRRSFISYHDLLRRTFTTFNLLPHNKSNPTHYLKCCRAYYVRLRVLAFSRTESLSYPRSFIVTVTEFIIILKGILERLQSVVVVGCSFLTAPPLGSHIAQHLQSFTALDCFNCSAVLQNPVCSFLTVISAAPYSFHLVHKALLYSHSVPFVRFKWRRLEWELIIITRTVIPKVLYS